MLGARIGVSGRTLTILFIAYKYDRTRQMSAHVIRCLFFLTPIANGAKTFGCVYTVYDCGVPNKQHSFFCCDFVFATYLHALPAYYDRRCSAGMCEEPPCRKACSRGIGRTSRPRPAMPSGRVTTIPRLTAGTRKFKRKQKPSVKIMFFQLWGIGMIQQRKNLIGGSVL